MNRTATETVTHNLDVANRVVVTCRQLLTEAVAAGNPSERLADSVNRVANAEGQRDFWLRMQQAAAHTGEEFTESLANRVALSALSRGADDSWSGRGNDVKRAYFDGMREAAQEVEWIF